VGAKDLYLPEKFRVLVGRGNSVGLCTVWSEPSIVTKTAPGLLDSCSIIGTLYSKEGVNIILRNLCLNPEIRHLLIWGRGPLSKTPIGRTGWEILEKVWQNGVAEDGKVNGSGFRLHDNIDFSVINKVIKNVELIDVSDADLPTVLERIAKLKKPHPRYMEPTSFPVFQRETIEGLPSEEVGWSVRGRKTADAWIRVVDRIIRYGTVKPDEYGKEIKEIGAVTWVIEDERTSDPLIPDWPENLRHTLGILTKESIDSYVNSVFRTATVPEGTTYTYGQRLRAYRTGEGALIDQIGFLIDKMKACNTSRRAVATVWDPEIDTVSKSPVCLTQMQVLQTNGRINLFASFRTHDIFKAGILNAFGIRSVQEEIASALGFEVGKLSITSISAHIYEEDWDDARNLCKCEIWERPVDAMLKTVEMGDSRGTVLVRLEDGNIIGDVTTAEGELIYRIESKTANEACLKLSRLDLLSQPSHYMDIARQFQKAEIARDLGVAFEQDKPLKIHFNGRDVLTGKN